MVAEKETSHIIISLTIPEAIGSVLSVVVLDIGPLPLEELLLCFADSLDRAHPLGRAQVDTTMLSPTKVNGSRLLNGMEMIPARARVIA